MNKDFFDKVASIIEKARTYVGRTADLTMCITYFEVGRMIVEKEQGGKTRAKYGSELLVELSAFLNKRFGSGFSETTLKYSRKFYKIYAPSIRQAMTDESENQKGQAMLDVFANCPFKLSWSHYLILMRIQLVFAREEFIAAKAI